MGKAILMLKDGTFFVGEAFGARTERVGEVVFNTSLTGYQEILTDPSYKGQIVVMTYTEIGNYGVNDVDTECESGPQVEGFVVKECSRIYSNWRARRSLDEYLKAYGIPGLYGIDTRALTRHLRTYGAQMGIISSVDTDPHSLLSKVRAHPDISELDLVSRVTCRSRFTWEQGVWTWPDGFLTRPNDGVHGRCLTLVVYNFGVKLSILRNAYQVGFKVVVVPADTPPEAVLEMNPDAILLSNGPGDPQMVRQGIEAARKLIGKKPVFGICLGHQILGLALGGRTYKLKFGHHGGNHPVKDLKTGRVQITAQNHNYCVDVKSLKDQVRLTHQSLFDGSEEGMEHVEYPVFSVQHHPEAGPGPNDARDFFTRMYEITLKQTTQ